MRRYVAAIMVLVVAAVSCKKAPSVSFGNETLTVSAAGGTVSVALTTNRSWEASSDVSWITVLSKAGSDGEGVLSLRLSPSKLADERTGKVSVKCEDLTKVLTVVQSARDQINPEGDSYILISSDAQDFEIRLEANVGYEVSTDVEWLHDLGTKGLVSSSVCIRADANAESASRIGNVIFTNKEKGVEQFYEVTQSGRPQNLVIVHSQEAFTLPVVFGFGLSALVDWGDGSSEKYTSSLRHDYSRSGTYTVSICASNASTLSFPDIKGISSIDISDF